MTDSTRAAFEAWIDSVDPDVEDLWDAWQAAYQADRLSALAEVEAICESLLEQHDPGGDCSAGMGFRDAIEAATEAIGQLAAQAGKPQGENQQ